MLLAVPGRAAAEVLAEHGQALAGTVVIDATNNIGAAEINCRSAVASSAPGGRPPRGDGADQRHRPGAGYVGDGSAAGIVDGLLPLLFASVQQSGGNRKIAFSVVR